MPARKDPRIEKLLESLREDLGSEAFVVHDREPLDIEFIELFRPSDHDFGIAIRSGSTPGTFDLSVSTPGGDPEHAFVGEVAYEDVREAVRRVCRW